MSVSNGQNADAATFNGAFPSKSVNSTVTSIYTLNNAAPASGPVVTNLQASINGVRPTTYSLEQLAAAGNVTTSTVQGWQYRKIESTGGAVTLANKLFGAAGGWLHGTVILLVGNSDTNTITINNADEQYGAILNGTMLIKKYHIIELIYDSSLERWIELRRNVA
jgi:hypothetical protein